MEKVVLQREGKRPLEFKGDLLATWESSPDSSNPKFSGSVGRWSEVRVYRSARGRFVVAWAGHSQWEGEAGVRQAEAFDNLEDLISTLEEWHPRAAAAIAADLQVCEPA